MNENKNIIYAIGSMSTYICYLNLSKKEAMTRYLKMLLDEHDGQVYLSREGCNYSMEKYETFLTWDEAKLENYILEKLELDIKKINFNDTFEVYDIEEVF